MAAEAHDTDEKGARSPQRGEEEIVELVAGILLERHPGLVAFEELMAEVGDRAPSSVLHDAVDELERLGLAHCLAEFVFASWSAVRARRLGI